MHDGLTKPEAVAMPSKAFQTHESCSPASVGRGCDVTRTRWLKRVKDVVVSAGAMQLA